jgi:hypothetical protein
LEVYKKPKEATGYITQYISFTKMIKIAENWMGLGSKLIDEFKDPDFQV